MLLIDFFFFKFQKKGEKVQKSFFKNRLEGKIEKDLSSIVKKRKKPFVSLLLFWPLWPSNFFHTMIVGNKTQVLKEILSRQKNI